MDITTKLLNRTPIYLFDDSKYMQEHLYQPFAWGDTFLREVNRDKNKTIIHIWPMTDTLILGMLDRRLPYCDEAIKAIRTHGYRAVVRNVGGLAVVSDEGVLNFSIILPKREEEKLSIQAAYDLMVAFIRRMFAQYQKEIKHFTVEDSYCPGEYDLSIDGKKFAGIAQRRFKDGIAISIYLSVYGDQEKRGQLVRTFYEKGSGGEETKFKFPRVNPASMANLSELLGEKLSLTDVKERMVETLIEIDADCRLLQISPELKAEYQGFYEKMIERNRKV